MRKSRSNQNEIIQYDSVLVTNCYGKTHPDGKWGWCVVVTTFVTQFVIVCLQNSSGDIFNELIERYNQAKRETGTISIIKFACNCFQRDFSLYWLCSKVQK